MEHMDILCLQEHWLYAFEENMLRCLLGDKYLYTMKCIDDQNPINPSLKPRGQGGVLTLWKPEIDHLITPLDDGAERNLAIMVGTESHGTVLLNSYMPTAGSQDCYAQVLDEVHEILEKHATKCHFIWCGDLNASLTRCPPSSNDKKLRQFIKEADLITTANDPPKPTYHHFMGGITSTIDHILTTKNHSAAITQFNVLSRQMTNLSSHDPVSAIIEVPEQQQERNTDDTIMEARKKPRWDKIDRSAYEELTGTQLSSLIECGGLLLPNEVLVERLNSILLDCSDRCGPKPPRKKKKKKAQRKYPWSDNLKPIMKDLKHAFYWWKHNDKDPNHPLAARVKNLKKSLRSHQRQLAAIHRRDQLEEIANAATSDRNLFYRLVGRQRGSQSRVSNHVIFNGGESQLDGWATYFETLATDIPAPHYDTYHLHASELRHHSNALEAVDLCRSSSPVYVTDEVTRKHISSLKLKKAADVYGLTGEHLRFASHHLVTILTQVINNCLDNQSLPDQFKQGAIVPSLKKSKPPRCPDSYRRITVASTVGKIVEKNMMHHTKSHARTRQSQMQYGFTENCSPSICSFMVTEAVAEAKDTGSSLYISLLDSSKAFDVVSHTVMLNALKDLGINPHLWSLYSDMYQAVSSRVRLQGQLSRTIHEQRGIRQGGETSTEIFKAKDNSFLDKMQQHPASLRIGSIPVGIPTVADDNCLLADSHTNAQALLLMAEHNASKDRYTFSSAKSRVIHLQGRDADIPMELVFSGGPIKYSSAETHLGLVRSSNGRSMAAVSNRISVGRRTAYQLMGAGLCGLNGMSPSVSKNLIQVYVMPAMSYGLEAICMADKDLEEIEAYYRNLLRMMQFLPNSTAKPAIYLLMGCLPAEGLIHRKMLTLLMSILSRPGTPEHDVMIRQLCTKDLSSNSWTVQARLALDRYGLPPALQLAANPPELSIWKRDVKKAITKYWESTLKQQSSIMSSLSYLNMQMCGVVEGHPVWETGTDPRQVPMATIRAAILTGRYPLTGEKCAGIRRLDSCPYCGSPEAETIHHFTLVCNLHDDTRAAYIEKLEDLTGTEVNNLPQKTKLRYLIDPTHLTKDREEAVMLERCARHHFFKMHHRRAVQDGRGSMQLWATKRGKTQATHRQKTLPGPTLKCQDPPPEPPSEAQETPPGPQLDQGSPA